MSRASRGLVQRVREHIGFSVVAIGVLFVVLRLVGIRSTFAGFAMSVLITLALNVGLSYYQEYRAKNPRKQPAPRGGGDIRFREDHEPRRDDRYRDDDRYRMDDRYRIDDRPRDRRDERR